MTITRRRVAVAIALLSVATAAVLALLDADYRRVRETDELVEQMRAGDTPVLDDDIGDDIAAMLAAWQDEVGRP
jgi:hypothetical protein